jgi:hypothetical protein
MREILQWLILFFVLLSGVTTSAQQYVMIKGQVWDLTGDELVGAHAYNNTRHYGTFTNIDGIFFLVMVPGDTLTVSMIGYKNYTMRVPTRLSASNYKLDVTLLADTILLREAVIKPYPATYAEFKKEFLALEVPEELIIDRIIMPTEGYGSKYTLPGGGISLPGPFSLLYNSFSKEAKELKKMNKILARDHTRELLISKISRDMLMKQFGLKSDDDIDEMIINCGLTTEILEETSDYNIIRFVMECLQQKPKKQQ